MKEIEFSGSLGDIQRRVKDWKKANPHVVILSTGKPVRHEPDGLPDDPFRNDLGDLTNWTITIKYVG